MSEYNIDNGKTAIVDKNQTKNSNAFPAINPGLQYDFDLTVIRPRCDRPTTYVTSVGLRLPMCRLLHGGIRSNSTK